MSESKIERALVQGVKERNGMCLKFVSPGLSGVPDRIVLTPDGRVYFVELKADRGRVAAIQRYVISEMQRRKADVRVLKGLDEVQSFLGEVFRREV